MKFNNIQKKGQREPSDGGKNLPAARPGFAAYPALRLLLVAVAGILCGALLPLPLSWWLVAACALLVALVPLLGMEWRRRPGRLPSALTAITYLLLVFSAFSASASLHYRHLPSHGVAAFVGHPVVVSGRVAGRPSLSPTGTGFVLEVRELFSQGETHTLADRMKVFVAARSGVAVSVREGELVRVKGVPFLPRGPANLGEYDGRHAARLAGVATELYCALPWHLQKIGRRELDPFRLHVVEPVHDHLMDAARRLLPEGEGRELVVGLLTGRREFLGAETKEAFRRSGTAHILAISGLHVGMLVVALGLLLQRLRPLPGGRLAAFLLTGFLLLLYTLVSGGAPSVRRASLMAMVLLGAGLAGRRNVSLNALALADVLILLFDPLDLFQPGFLMTNGAVFSILFVHGGFRRAARQPASPLRRVGRFLGDAMLVTLSASLGVAPLIALFFGTFSLIGFLANVPVVLLSSLLVYSLLPTLVFDLLLPALAPPFAHASSFLASAVIGTVGWFSSRPHAVLSLQPAYWEVAAWYLLAAAALLFAFRRAWSRVAVALLAILNLFAWHGYAGGPAHEKPLLVSVNLGSRLALLYDSGFGTVQVDGYASPADMERVGRQLRLWGMGEPRVVAGFFLPDSLVAAAPASSHLPRSEPLLVEPGVVAARLDERVLKLWGRGSGLLLASGTGTLRLAEPFRADLAVLWINRFGPRQQRELERWLEWALPQHCLLVEGSFLPKRERALLRHVAGGIAGVSVRSKSEQLVVQRLR